MRVGAAKSDLSGFLDVTDGTEHTNAAPVVLSFAVHGEGLRDQALTLQVLGPPLEECGVSLSIYEVLKPVWHVELDQHSGHLGPVCAALDVVFDCHVNIADCF